MIGPRVAFHRRRTRAVRVSWKVRLGCLCPRPGTNICSTSFSYYREETVFKGIFFETIFSLFLSPSLSLSFSTRVIRQRSVTSFYRYWFQRRKKSAKLVRRLVEFEQYQRPLSFARAVNLFIVIRAFYYRIVVESTSTGACYIEQGWRVFIIDEFFLKKEIQKFSLSLLSSPPLWVFLLFPLGRCLSIASSCRRRFVRCFVQHSCARVHARSHTGLRKSGEREISSIVVMRRSCVVLELSFIAL